MVAETPLYINTAKASASRRVLNRKGECCNPALNVKLNHGRQSAVDPGFRHTPFFPTV